MIEGIKARVEGHEGLIVVTVNGKEDMVSIVSELKQATGLSEDAVQSSIDNFVSGLKDVSRISKTKLIFETDKPSDYTGIMMMAKTQHVRSKVKRKLLHNLKFKMRNKGKV